MDARGFNQTWETEYIKARVDMVVDSVQNGRYEQALDYLRMIQDKAKAAEILINCPKCNQEVKLAPEPK